MGKIKLRGLSDLKAGTIFCIGRNYAEHARELNNVVPGQPLVFLKPASSLTFDGPIQLPPQSNNVHHEVELIAAIGKGGKDIPQSEALSRVAGYAAGIDVTARDIQSLAKEQGHPWSVAKGFDTFAPLSSFIAAEHVGDPQNIELSLSVNGTLRQQSSTGLMIFPVAELISYLSSVFTLYPGDLIFTGTPQGVSPLTSGDHIKASFQSPLTELEIYVA